MLGQGQRNEKQYERVYVHVDVAHGEDGSISPLVLYWKNEDNIEVPYKITRPSKPIPAHSRKAGGQGLLFHVTIEDRMRDLYYDDFEKRFFVEKECTLAI